MCGILGYFKADGLLKSDLRKAMAALDTLRHRGPDGDGICLVDSKTGRSWSFESGERPSELQAELNLQSYLDGQADLFLGHRRLSIFDLSSRGHQPMRDTSGNLIVFNGEVYNFLELREELKIKGYEFKTDTDTEVILASYREWGAECLKRFNGMWTFILFDPSGRNLFVSNDRIGIKQLYHWGDKSEWMFASEIKAIRKMQGDGLTLDMDVAGAFLAHGQIDLTESTFFKEVRKFSPGHFLHSPVNELPINAQFRYWDFPSLRQRKISLEDAAHELRELLDDAIRLRMRSDVPWGTTLSGGLDSSSIVYAAHKLRKTAGLEPAINTFTAVFPGKEGDESEYVRFIEKDLGLNAIYTNPLEKFDFEDFEHFMYHQDLPVLSTSMYAQWAVMKSVSHSEVKVLLDGQGGDELFAGYHHHFYKYGRSLLLRGRLGALNKLIGEFCELKGLDVAKVKKTIRDDLKLFAKLKLGGKLPGPKEITDWNSAATLSEVLKIDLKSFIMPSLLRYEDRNSMAFGIEARLPFLDYRIVEFALTLPDEHKIQDGWQKYVLRMAMPDLPEAIRFRKDKKGFTTPQQEWIATHRRRFEKSAATAQECGVALPWERKNLSELDDVQLFRAASLGAWLRNRA